MDTDPVAPSAEDRLARLTARLLAGMETAAASTHWDRVRELADDVLTADPDNKRAATMLDRARAAQSLPEGQRAFVTLIFSDIVRSTDLVDVTEPEIVRALFRVYRQAAAESIEALGGTILQFQGDGIVACFGYPIVHEDAARRAVLASLGLVERIRTAAPELIGAYGTELSIRVGLHTGMVVVSGWSSGSGQPSDIVGATAHVAARLQAEAEPDTVVVSEVTRQLVESHFEMESVGTRALKGFARPMEVFRVVRSRRSGALMDADPGRTAPLIGRQREITLLMTTWAAVLAAHEDEARTALTVSVAVRGPAGIGKSRLAADLCRAIRDGGHEVFEVHGSPYHTNVALWPIAQLIEERLGFYADQAPAERIAMVERYLEAAGLDSQSAIPLLGPVLGLELAEERPRPELDPLALRAQTLEVLVEWLEQLVRATPALFIVENLHWADPSTVDLLYLLVERGIPGLLLLIISRYELETPWRPVHDIELGPLEAADAAQLVAGVAADRGLDPARAEMIVARGGGVPLFLQELAHNALGDSQAEAIPPRLQELMAARLRESSVDLRLAQLAATLGSVFDSELLATLAGGPVTAQIDQLVAEGILDPVGEVRQGKYRFHHDLLRDAAYATQLLDSRRQVHREVAELLHATARTPGDLAVVAHHHDLAGDVERSIPAYIAAAQAAQAEASHTEARRLLDRALEILAALPSSDERDLTELAVRLTRTVSLSSIYGYGYPDVYEDFQLADEISRRHTGRPEVMPAQVGIWSYLVTRGQVEAAKVVLEPLVNQVEAPDVAWFAPEIASCAGYTALFRGELRSARRWLEEAWEGYSARPPRATASPSWPLPHDPAVVTAAALACVSGLEGRSAESAQWEERAFALAEELDFPHGPFSAAFTSTYLAWLRMVVGDMPAAREFGLRTLSIAEQCRFDYFSVIGRQYVLVPEPALAVEVEHLDECGAGMDLVGHGAFRPVFLGIVARNHLYRGDPKRALSAVEDALLAVQRSGEWVHQPDLLRLRAEITAVARPDRMEEVVADLRAAIGVGLSQNSLVLALRAATTLALLAEAVRPGDWRETLRSVVGTLPKESTGPVLEDALAVLGD